MNRAGGSSYKGYIKVRMEWAADYERRKAALIAQLRLAWPWDLTEGIYG